MLRLEVGGGRPPGWLRNGVGAYIGLLAEEAGVGPAEGDGTNSWVGGWRGCGRLGEERGRLEGMGVLRLSRGELGPGGQERETDWGLVTWEKGSSLPARLELDWKNEIGEGIMVVAGGPTVGGRGGPPAPPPPTKLSSSALLATGSEAVTPKLSARLNPPPPPPGRKRGLAGLLFITTVLGT